MPVPTKIVFRNQPRISLSMELGTLHNVVPHQHLHTVRAKIITELILERAGPVIFKTFLLKLIALRLIPVISPARRAKPENYWK